MNSGKKIIRITEDVAQEIDRRREDGETPNDVIRRALGWEPLGDRRRKEKRRENEYCLQDGCYNRPIGENSRCEECHEEHDADYPPGQADA